MSFRIGAVLFDADGVVVDSECVWDRAQADFLARRGQPYHREETKHLLAGCSPLESARVIRDFYSLPESVESIAEERFILVRDLYRNNGVSFVPGFEDFFRQIAPELPVALATSMDPGLLDILDEHLGLRSLFRGHAYTAADVGGVGKPAPDLFLFAARQLKVDPAECLVLEDAPNGIEAARRAGMHVAAICTSHPASMLGRAHAVSAGFAVLPDALEKVGLGSPSRWFPVHS